MKKVLFIVTLLFLVFFTQSTNSCSKEFIVTVDRVPVNNILSIHVKVFVIDTYVVILRDTMNKVVYGRERHYDLGDNTESIDISEFKTGMYSLQVMNTGIEYTDTISIQK